MAYRAIGAGRALRRCVALSALGVLSASGIAACGGSADRLTQPADLTPPAPPPALSQRPFPSDNWWNTDISAQAVDPNSSTLITACGTQNLHPDFGTTFGIPYIVVGAGAATRPITVDYADESDAGPYPIPLNAPIEGGANSTGDRHVIVVDTAHSKLYETWDSHPLNGGTSWHAGSGAVFDLTSDALRPSGWTSADAAGLPIFPGLVRYDEAVESGTIAHALRFTCPRTQAGFITPARHFASSDASASLPPMGMRVRLKASFDVSTFPSEVQVILRACRNTECCSQTTGAAGVSGAPDTRWSDTHLDALKSVPSSAFEVVVMGPITH